MNSNKTVIITGAASGFGFRTAELLEPFFNLVLIDNDKSNYSKMKARFKNSICILADVSTSVGIKKIKNILKSGDIDICINNAGWSYYKKDSELTTEKEFDAVFKNNVKSIFFITNYLIPIFKKNKNGYILNIGSTAAIRPRAGLAWYNATKAAVNNVTKTLALELAPYNVRVNCLNPAFTLNTGLTTAFAGGEVTKSLIKTCTDMVPLGRLCNIDDVAQTIKDLLMTDNKFMTGQIFNIDGGRCI